MKSIVPLALLAAALIPAAHAQVYRFDVPLSGSQEFPGPGDADGTGFAVLYIDAALNAITWEISVQDIALPITADHIHRGAAGTSGPVRVDFMGMLDGGPVIDPDLAGVLADPSGWYVNVHNSFFPAGAIRGQLGQGVLVPESSTFVAGAGVVGIGMAALARRWRRQAN